MRKDIFDENLCQRNISADDVQDCMEQTRDIIFEIKNLNLIGRYSQASIICVFIEMLGFMTYDIMTAEQLKSLVDRAYLREKIRAEQEKKE